MDRKNRPQGRRRTYGNGSVGAHREGQGLGSGPVGQQGGYAGRGDQQGSHGPVNIGGGTPSGNGGRRGFGGRSPLMLIIIAVIALLGGGGGLSQLLGGAPSTLTYSGDDNTSSAYQFSGTETGSSSSSGSAGAGSYYDMYSQLFGGGSSSSSQSSGSPTGSFGDLFSSDWSAAPAGSSSGQAAAVPVANNTSQLDTSVAPGARSKFTNLLGNRQDTVTMMVYMCGADLESRSGMATKDLMEMAAAATDNINLIVYTGGAQRWNNNVISADTNQIYRVTKGGLDRLEANAGNQAMTSPDTLSSFIKYCAKQYPANRNILIFWDHGGGSVSGYGYDEKNKGSGAMSLSGIDKALSDGGVQFDFVGFDACLMATAETAVMVGDHADYLIGSEETEPGIGWYYTNWVNMLNENTSTPTLQLGKQIADDFVAQCAKSCPGQKTTLSVTDLAEAQATLPGVLKSFATSTTKMIKSNQYKSVSDARNRSREFGQGSGVDMVDLIDLAQKLGSEEGTELSKTIDSAVKYNVTSPSMTNAYGLSVYFPYSSLRYVDSAVKNFRAIGMDDEYSKCIQEFANLEASGQIAAGGSAAANPYQSIFGNFAGTSYSSSGSSSSDMIGSLLGSFLSGNMAGLSGLSSSNSGFLSGRDLSVQEVSDYIAENHFDAEDMQWTLNDNGQHVLNLSEEQWDLVHELDLNMFADDGTGYIDLGLDNIYDWDDDGNLIGDTDGTWLTIDGHIVSYYHLDTVDDGTDVTVTGRVPALLNGERINLLLVFDSEHPEGYIAGATSEYTEGETETVAKNMTQLSEGDELQFLCDYYDYDGNYQDSYHLGEPITVDDDMPIRNQSVDGSISTMYRLTDIYNQEYWTPAIEAAN